MRYLMTALAALSLGTLPLAAQVPARPAQPAAPVQPAGPPAQLTEQQLQQHQAIREKYAKELQAHRDAMQALNEKMRAEIEATLTPEQRQARQQGVGRRMGLGMGGGRGMGLGQGGGRMGGLNSPPEQRAMLWNRADRAARQIIMMRDRMVMRAMRQERGAGRVAQPDMKGGRGGMMGQMGQGDMMGQMGQGDMMGRIGQGTGMGQMNHGDMNMTGGAAAPKQAAPKVVKPAPSKAPPAPPAPVKKPATGGGG